MPPLLSSTQPSIRARILPRFPAQVLAGNGMVITKSGNTYTFATTAAVTEAADLLSGMQSDRLIGRDSAGAGAAEELTLSGGLGFTAAGGIQMTANQRLRTIPLRIDKPGGGVLTPGVVSDVQVPFTCTIVQATMLADTSGSIVIDIWKDTYANYPPTVADTITAAAKPTISSDVKYTDSTLTGWTTSVTAGDVLRFNIDSSSSITRVYFCLHVTAV